MTRDFPHRHAGHCETGALTALLRDRALDLSESLVFGIGSGLFFVHLPLVKVGGIPLTAYRVAPRMIIRKACKRLGIDMRTERFRSTEAGRYALDRLLANGVSVGLQTSVFWLPYFPPDMRFQFNAHNLVAYAKSGDEYLLSDPVFEDVVRCQAADLQRARFAKGTFAPRGLLYYPEKMPDAPDVNAAIRAGLRDTCRQMLGIPLPFIGVRGIGYLARQIERWPAKLGFERARSYVSSVVRMQEEIGTGGAGFRFMYAAFLQEAGNLLNEPRLHEASRKMTETGDRWRDFAVLGAKLCKSGGRDAAAYSNLAEVVRECAEREKQTYQLIRSIL